MKTTFTQAQKTAIAVAALNRAKKLNPTRDEDLREARELARRSASRVSDVPQQDDSKSPCGHLSETLANRRSLGLSNRIDCLTPYIEPLPHSYE